MPVFRKTVLIRAPIEQVYAFHLDPQNLVRIAPPGSHTSLERCSESPLRVGSRVVVRSVQAGIPVRIEAEIVQLQPPLLLEDRQVSGPFRVWVHSHRFQEQDGGTQLVDEVRYELPGGTLGGLVMGRTVARELESNFAFRHQATREILEMAGG